MAKDKTDPKAIHFVGIKGMGMSAIAIMAKERGYHVTGSDEATVYPTDALLSQNDIEYFTDFDAKHLAHRPKVVISAAYNDDNPEVKEAKKLRLTIRTYSEMLGELMDGFEGVGVAGVHGKTTTTSLLAYILQEAGYSPSYAIGAPKIAGLASNGHIGNGKYFVVEADEYRKEDRSPEPKFLDLPLKHVIITSIELDHPDMYQSAERLL